MIKRIRVKIDYFMELTTTFVVSDSTGNVYSWLVQDLYYEGIISPGDELTIPETQLQRIV